jgi:drug/metabolite transporter (DMT)-like permease
MVLLSWVAAFVACFGYGIGSVLQSIGARRAAQVAGLSGVALIVVQLPYLLGLAADMFAFVANVVALQRLPLFLVQSIVSASVAVTAVIAALRGARFGWRGWTSLAVLGLGLVLLCMTADSESAVRVSMASEWVILGSAVLPVPVGLLGLRLPHRSSALVLACAAGLAFAGVAVASRGISGLAIGWPELADPLLWTILVQGAIGTVFFALALQRGAVTSVTAITFVIEMIVPSIVGLLIFGDTVDPGQGGSALAGFLLAVVGTVSLIHFAE